MKPTIQLRLGQHLTMTPQLQQAIKLLQLSTLDLKQEIQDALDSNLMLETEEEGQLRDASGEQPSAEEGGLTCISCHDAHGTTHTADLLVPPEKTFTLCTGCHRDVAKG